MKASSQNVRGGVSCRYWFQMCSAMSCGEDLEDRAPPLEPAVLLEVEDELGLLLDE